MNKILFPVEFSDHDPVVLEYATELAYLFKAQLIISNFIESKENLQAKTLSGSDSRNMVNLLNQFINKHYPKDHRQSVQIRIAEVEEASETRFLQMVENEKIDLIISGINPDSHHTHRDAICRIMATSKIPVFMVPETLEKGTIDRMLSKNLKQISDFYTPASWSMSV